jgi:hypothetical protein
VKEKVALLQQLQKGIKEMPISITQDTSKFERSCRSSIASWKYAEKQTERTVK